MCILNIRDYVEIQQVKKEDKSILNKANILYKITGMRAPGPLEECRVVCLDVGKRRGWVRPTGRSQSTMGVCT